MRALVTGGAGFLGSHLCDALLAEGCAVIAVDNLLTGARENLEHLGNERRFEFREHDVCEPFDVGSVDLVFHLASPASPVDYLQYGLETLRAGSAGTTNALAVAQKHGARFVLASTSECYGDPKEHPQSETYWGNVNPVGPRSVYDESKRFAEATTMAYRRYRQVDTRIVRLFNTYGPRMQLNDGRVVPNFLQQALRGEDLTVYGSGAQTRSFCYVTDLVDGLLRMARSAEAAKLNGSPVNLGNPEEFTVLDCAYLVLHLTGSRSGIRHMALPEDDPQQRRPDIAIARAVLGWEPKVDLSAGLRLSLEYFRRALEPREMSEPMRAAS
ncbi:MAG: SDR family oxidoreductase [Candidatus Koribacter versatilis]|uniref:SDR family oxidoreductase n=1 Tax=Candidatus Korobacter versatilis TaxID=658062 RepID=A0A932AB52_9BACT|nr:SDR family oxidoreductase [Candidatus Koribacter versatilis]